MFYIIPGAKAPDVLCCWGSISTFIDGCCTFRQNERVPHHLADPGGYREKQAVPSGPSSTDQMLQNQQQQDERKIDEQNQEIATLKKELEELKAKK